MTTSSEEVEEFVRRVPVFDKRQALAKRRAIQDKQGSCGGTGAFVQGL